MEGSETEIRFSLDTCYNMLMRGVIGAANSKRYYVQCAENVIG